jgi:hypothetical protein
MCQIVELMGGEEDITLRFKLTGVTKNALILS